MSFKELSLHRKLILGAGALAVISLFFPWVDLGFISASGFQQQGYLFLIAFIYPVYCAFKNRSINKIGGLVCGFVAVIASIIFINSKSENFFGETINASGTGLYLFLIASIVLTIAMFLNQKNHTA